MRLLKSNQSLLASNVIFLLSISFFVSSMFTIGLITLFATSLLTPVTLFATPLIADGSNDKAVGDYRKDVMAFVKRTKNKKDFNQRFGAVVDLCRLHHQLVNDPCFQANQQIKGFRAIAADRLKKCSREIEVEINRTRRKNERIRKLDKTKSRDVPSEKADSGLSQIPDKISEKEFLEQSLVHDMQFITQITGGPVNLWQYTGPNFGPNGICDYGPDLVQLIESTISPDSWQANGGNGVIHYYWPLRILVVSASSQVHDQLTDLLNQLR